MIMHLCYLPVKRAKEIGSKTYCAYKACSNGHFVQRKVSKRACFICINEASKRRSKRITKDPVKSKIRAKKQRDKYYSDDERRERLLKDQKKYYRKNFDRISARQVEYVAKNKEMVDKYQADYYKRNREKIIQYQYDYKEKNPEKSRYWLAKCARKRRLRTRSPNLSELDELVFQECAAQAIDMERIFGGKWHIDHIIPLNARNVSGLHSWNNVQVIPGYLNESKHNKLIYTEPLEWLRDAT